VQGTSGRLGWLAGGTWLRFRQTRATLVDGLLPGDFLDRSLPVTFPFPFAFVGGGSVTTEALAAYADGKLALSGTVALRIGGRYSDDAERAREFLTFLAPTITGQRRGFQAFDVSGNALPLTSRWQGKASAQYRADLAGGSRLDLNGAMQWRSEYFFTEFNTADARQSGFARFDLGAVWTSADGGWAVNIFARNLTDRRVLSSLAVVSPLLGSVLWRPSGWCRLPPATGGSSIATAAAGWPPSCGSDAGQDPSLAPPS
jgi:hypothetical protein